MKKVVSLFIVFVVILTMVAGCGTEKADQEVVEKSDATKDNEATSEQADPVELRFALWAGGKELEEFQAIVDEVNAGANGEFEIIVESIPDNYTQKLSTQFAGGNAADLIWLSQDNINAFAELGALYDISTLNQSTSNDFLKADNYFESIIKTAKLDGKLYGLPWIANPVIMYFNTSLFEAYGVELPKADENGVIGAAGDWSWDDFMKVAEQFPNGNGSDDYGWITGGWPPLEMYLWAEGGDILNSDFESEINTPESIKGLELAKKLLTSGITPDVASVWDQGFSESFLNGRIAMIMAGAADDFELREMVGFTKEDLAYGLVPSGSDGKHYSFNWTASTVMNAKTENPEMAYKAMEAMTLKFFEWKVTPPVKGGVDYIDDMLEGTKVVVKPTIVAALEDTRGGNYHKSYGEINIWGNLYEPLLLDPENFVIEDAVKELEEKINEILNR